MTDAIRNEIKVDKTALSYWFPKAEIPVPRTTIITMPLEAQKVVWKWFDGIQSDNEEQALVNAFVEELRIAALGIGFPIFLRTDHTSAKHSWKDTCFVKSPDMPWQAPAMSLI
jgi:hypothetical protein